MPYQMTSSSLSCIRSGQKGCASSLFQSLILEFCGSWQVGLSINPYPVGCMYLLHSQAEGSHFASLYPLPHCGGPVITNRYHMTYWETISILYKMGENMVVLFIFIEQDPFFYYFIITKTLNLIRPILTPLIKIYQKALLENYIHTLQDGRKYCESSSYSQRQSYSLNIL